ncbi:MAG: 2-hydroxychromene-2-carboxylate isomerase [Notoacmeibacter sp.]|nr:2-hydroxychromene-2-carboxylate isomerase [Notoacmeibacter sp.]
MTSPVEFWFDFSSPYAYFAAVEIDERLGRFGKPVVWRPFLLGVAFRRTGIGPVNQIPMRGEYAIHDCHRIAATLDIPFRLRADFPFPSQALARAFYWFDARNPELAIDFAMAAFETYFGQGLALADAESVIALAARFTDQFELVSEWLACDEARLVLRKRTMEALDKGVFGSPFVLVGDEPFWGWDRLPMVEAWLEQSAKPDATGTGLSGEGAPPRSTSKSIAGTVVAKGWSRN